MYAKHCCNIVHLNMALKHACMYRLQVLMQYQCGSYTSSPTYKKHKRFDFSSTFDVQLTILNAHWRDSLEAIDGWILQGINDLI